MYSGEILDFFPKAKTYNRDDANVRSSLLSEGGAVFVFVLTKSSEDVYVLFSERYASCFSP